MTSLLTGTLSSPEGTFSQHNCTHLDGPASSGQEGGLSGGGERGCTHKYEAETIP